MAQLAIKNLSKLAPFAGGPWNLQQKFHLYLIKLFDVARWLEIISGVLFLVLVDYISQGYNTKQKSFYIKKIWLLNPTWSISYLV